jgi:hypothetical protein
LNDAVLAVERAYVAAATATAPPMSRTSRTTSSALACAGAVASRYLAVGTPRSFGLVIDRDAGAARLSLDAHRTWFAPTDLRCAGAGADDLAAAIGGRVVPLAEALAADIVCIHAPLALTAAQLRRGTHVNALAEVTLDDDLRRLATIVDEPRGLPALAAGLVDGRQLDEITIFVAGDAAIAAVALADLS